MDRDFDRLLLDRLRANDPAAFDDVHQRCNGRLFSFLTRLSRRRDVAEDLLEETWLRLAAKAATLRPDTQIDRWLFTVARNLYVSYCRSRLLEASHAADLIGLWPCGSPLPSPFEETASNEFERRVESALASLPASHREVLLLVGVEGLQPTDAAAILGVTPEALRQRLRRARLLLARRLEPAEAVKISTATEVTT